MTSLVARSEAAVPVEWLTGTATFLGHEVVVHEGVRAPQATTEVIAMHAAERLPERGIALERRVDVIVASAPRTPSAEVPGDASGASIDGGYDGLDVLRDIAWRAPRWLRADGHLVLEIDEARAEDVIRLLAAYDLVDAELLRDTDGVVRGISARHAPRRP